MSSLFTAAVTSDRPIGDDERLLIITIDEQLIGALSTQRRAFQLNPSRFPLLATQT